MTAATAARRAAIHDFTHAIPPQERADAHVGQGALQLGGWRLEPKWLRAQWCHKCAGNMYRPPRAAARREVRYRCSGAPDLIRGSGSLVALAMKPLLLPRR